MENGEFGLVLLFATVTGLLLYWVPYYLITRLGKSKILKSKSLTEKLIKYIPLGLSLFGLIYFFILTTESETYIPYYQNLFFLVSFILIFATISIVTFVKKISHRITYILIAYIGMIMVQLLKLIP